jgi:ABC-type phosphate transport system substrate-binding protein
MQEEIGVVANPENPIEGIELIELKAIFSGQTGNWKEIAGVDSQISVWVYPPENEVQRFITTRLLESDAISSLAHLAPDPEAMIEAIAADPASIGFLPLSWRTSSVKILPIIDVDQTNTIMPVLVLADREPQGGEREFVACLQNHSR